MNSTITYGRLDPVFGAIFGDIVGSVYEFNNIKTKNFPMFRKDCFFTDDTVLTLAIGEALIHYPPESFKEALLKYGKRHPYAGYGNRFLRWLASENPQPYNSCGNGSAMRVSALPCFARSLKDCEHAAELSARPTHDHPDGIAGAKATAGAIYLAQRGATKDEIKTYVDQYYADEVSDYVQKNGLSAFTLDEIRPIYRFDKYASVNRGTVPFAVQAFLESDSFEDCIRNTVSIGGDTDTLAAISGPIAAGFYGFNHSLYNMGLIERLTPDLRDTLFLLMHAADAADVEDDGGVWRNNG